ncbi:hypothetical protein BBJ28_00015879 [Nothophytophthora sp. Chile5]|nr:hypothetical protein BBJ28_00015879 [Nothophytophthora sp. Chile5]
MAELGSRFAVAATGSQDSVMYSRKDNSIREFGKQAVQLARNWQVRSRHLEEHARTGCWLIPGGKCGADRLLQFVLPFALNQSGSVVYVYLLGSAGTVTTAAQRQEADDAVDVAQDSIVQEPTSQGDARVDALWDDINASTAVSSKAAARTAKLLGGLKGPKRMGTTKKSGKRKLREFQIPVLSVDVKRSRQDLPAAAKQKVDRVVKFAGKEYSTVEAKRQQGGSKGLDQVLASLDEPKKVSTMEKTSLDWDKFKEAEGIEEELTQYTKDGCALAIACWGSIAQCKKQEFLQRLDVKRFEIEKAERDKQRRLQQQQPK